METRKNAIAPSDQGDAARHRRQLSAAFRQAILNGMPSWISKQLSHLKPKRRWAQFSLGTMLLAVTLLCVWLADYVSPVRKLERQLSDLNEEIREQAAEWLGYMGPDARSATPSLLLLAKNDTSSPVRVRAVWSLSRVSGRAALLEPLLTDSDEHVSFAAAEGMLWLGHDSSKVASVLLARVGYQDVGSILEGMGPDQAASIIPFLLDRLKQTNHVDGAAAALRHAALPADAIVPALTARLNHKEPRLRIAAAEQLLRMRGAAKESVPALRARLDDPDRTCAATCAAALCAIEPGDATAVQVLKAALRSGERMLAYRAAVEVSLLGPDAAIFLDDLVALVCDSPGPGGWPSPFAGTIVQLGAPAVDALDYALKDAMSDRDRFPSTAKELRERIANIAWVSLPVVRRLLRSASDMQDARDDQQELSDDLLRSSDHSATVRFFEWAEKIAAERAAPHRHAMIPFYLGMFGPNARRAAPTLIRALDYPDFRGYSIHALAAIGPDAAPAIPKLLAIVKSDDAGFGLEAYTALHNIAATDHWADEEFRQATAKVVALLDSGDEPRRINAFSELEKTGVRGEWAHAQLRHFLKSEDRYMRAHAARVLAASQVPADDVLPTLIELALDPHFGNGEGIPVGESYSPGVREELIRCMASFGDAALPGLMAALHDKNPRVRRVSAEALGMIGPPASEAVPELIELLDDEIVWAAAAESLGRIGPESRTAVPKLIESLAAMRKPPIPSEYPEIENPDDYDWSGYDAADHEPFLSALAGIGEDARSAVPEVLRIANFDDRAIRQAAVVTLARIDPANPSLMARLRRLLVEWERRSATEDLHSTWLKGDPAEKLAEAIRDLGPHAKQIATDLERIVMAEHLINWKVRCYAAFALASFPPHKKAAVTCLENFVPPGLLNSFESTDLAHGLLQRIKGVPKSKIRPRVVYWGVP